MQKPAIFHSHKKEVCSLRCTKMHKPQKTTNDQFFILIDTMQSNPPKIANLGSNFNLKISILKVEKYEFPKKSIKKMKNNSLSHSYHIWLGKIKAPSKFFNETLKSMKTTFCYTMKSSFNFLYCCTVNSYSNKVLTRKQRKNGKY